MKALIRPATQLLLLPLVASTYYYGPTPSFDWLYQRFYGLGSYFVGLLYHFGLLGTEV